MTNEMRGVAAIVAACTIWGLSGLYFDGISHVGPLEVLSHRVIWSLAFFILLFTLQKRLPEFRAAFSQPRRLGRIGLAAIAVSANWFGYIWAIQNGHATEASMGYYIFPLVAVAMGYFAFGERFSPLQRTAIALALGAVLVLTLQLGTPPWIALILAASFGTYGLIKKALPLGPVLSVGVETALLLPLALGFLIWQGTAGRLVAVTPGDVAYLMLSAGFTGVPLVLFSYASRRLAYATLGLVQYMNPTLQFVIAMIYFGEPFGPAQALAFPLIWAGVALYCVDLWRRDRAARRLPPAQL
ncbi:EamA family transporter RarD [Halovulum dunhuangense]|uniref:EamA family transporter RarD n=1 Tax=Halovulum dunhuangense TaxID=1505036 RepID=A0A849L6Y0_9RHOB|nr:EamA family transporter RarD [Halovulum dunhuangense]NNU81870.1 EamA family transporter RarD [Halovulum dunhuangense]